MQTVTANLKFQCPFGAYVCGPTMSGKSTLVFELIRNAANIFSPAPARIVYAYGVYQKAFENLPNVEFVKGLDAVLDEDFFDSNINNLLILDDLSDEICHNKKASTLFTRGVHHKNVSVLFLLQNLFKQGPAMRDITLNCQYWILFKNGRDMHQIEVLGRQLGLKHLVSAYEKCIKESYGYLLVDLHPKTPDLLRLQSHIFDYRRVYLPK
jgi:hypothetical protein